MNPKEISGLISRIKSLCDEVEASLASDGKPKKLSKDEYLNASDEEREKNDEGQLEEKKEEKE